MMSDTTPENAEPEALPSAGTAPDDAPAPANPAAPGRTQVVDETAQEEAAEERAKGGGYN
jgi:hypothetical protein